MLNLNNIDSCKKRILELSTDGCELVPEESDYRVAKYGYGWKVQQYYKGWFGLGKAKWHNTGKNTSLRGVAVDMATVLAIRS